MKKNNYLHLIIAIVLALFFQCVDKKAKPEPDFSLIKKKGELTAITLSGSISYFIYKGEPMGYEYELLKNFADAYNLKLNIKIAENLTRLTEMLESGQGDLAAYNIPMTNELKDKLIFCGRENIDEQVLVQRNGRNDTLLKDVTQMIGKEVWVVKGSKFDSRLKNLNAELGGGINIHEIEKDTVSVEDLIEMVSSGKIKYTVSDKNVAQLNKTYYSNININLKISHPQRSSWAVRSQSVQLADTLDHWFQDYTSTPKYTAIMKRYFEMSKTADDETIPILSGKNISKFDPLFKKYAHILDWDWRLLASIAYQESRFETAQTSWAGAVGLMGLMPRTARTYGLDPDKRDNPEENLRAASKYIQSLKDIFAKIGDENQKLRFVLASYNSGIGHIFDAQALARKFGKNPEVWEGNVEECLKLKSLPEFYNDSVCRYGYFRSAETIYYVQHVIQRWKQYEEKVKR